MEYKEVTSKGGKLIVFCKFEDLLKEAYGVNTIEEVQRFLESNGEYICHCPFCKAEGHSKHKLYISGDLTVGHCFVCTRAFVNIDDELHLDVKVPEFFALGYQNLDVVKLSDPVWSLDKYWNEFDDYSEIGFKYLLGRHKYLAQLYKVLEFKFFDDNIVMPFKYHGEIFYYQIRFTGNSKIRYYFPPISKKPPYIIENGNCKRLLLVEGVYDAIAALLQAPGYTPVAVLGSSISDYQIEFLREYVPEKIKIYMDETKISCNIRRSLVKKIDYCPIDIIPSNGRDPEENLKELIDRNLPLGWIK